MSNDSDFARLTPQVVEIAAQAGKKILTYFTKDSLDVSFKEDNSPLTQADMEAHNHITKALQEMTPHLPVLSEESFSEFSRQERSQWERFWLVDPLDGTKEFIRGADEFTVNIALIDKSRPIMGVVNAPALNKYYYAWKGAGAFRSVSGGEPERINVSDYRHGRLQVVASRSHKTGELQVFLDRLGECDVVSAGSSLKLMMVAEGSAHIYPRLGPTMEWDTAAAQIVVEEAGGLVTNLSGEPLSCNTETMLNPFFMVTGDPPYPWQEEAQGL